MKKSRGLFRFTFLTGFQKPREQPRSSREPQRQRSATRTPRVDSPPSPQAGLTDDRNSRELLGRRKLREMTKSSTAATSAKSFSLDWLARLQAAAKLKGTKNPATGQRSTRPQPTRPQPTHAQPAPTRPTSQGKSSAKGDPKLNQPTLVPLSPEGSRTLRMDKSKSNRPSSVVPLRSPKRAKPSNQIVSTFAAVSNPPGSNHSSSNPASGSSRSTSNRPTLEELRSRRRSRRSSAEGRSGGDRQRVDRNSMFAPPENPIPLPTPRSRSGKALLVGVRLLILGVGLGVIVGTVFSVWDPTAHMAGANSGEQTANQPEKTQETPALPLGQEAATLKAQIQSVLAQNEKLTAGVMLADLDTQAYVDINASETFAAASTIKFPVLVAFFQEVDAGRATLNEMLTMTKELVADEAGEMQFQPVGTKFSAIKTVTDMMMISDNTATNLIINRVGGAAALNQRFASWGLTSTQIRNWLPDVKGTNTTSPKDMATLFALVNEGKLVSMKSRDRILDIMRKSQAHSLLPKGLGEGASIAHKTGTIGELLADVGLIDTANGNRYVAAVLVKRPRDDDRAETLIQQISKLSYKTFNQSQAAVPAPENSEMPGSQGSPDSNNRPNQNNQNNNIGRSRIAQP
ncbi:serine hydrolase [Alkalinema pantanalense CENA528]|uniref:serine hydrolase n=1 Tax=Alkalinema pantanalense TaxID=1620705 RepID=UPI003D6E87D1